MLSPISSSFERGELLAGGGGGDTNQKGGAADSPTMLGEKETKDGQVREEKENR